MIKSQPVVLIALPMMVRAVGSGLLFTHQTQPAYNNP